MVKLNKLAYVAHLVEQRYRKPQVVSSSLTVGSKMESIINKNHKTIGGLIVILGFLLSPLSWWNDLIINIPLAYLIATGLTLVVPNYFAMFMIMSYWLTNVLGLVLMHRGSQLVFHDEERPYDLHSVIKDLTISLVYSLILGILVMTGILKLPMEYF